MDTPRHDIEIHQGASFAIGFSYLDPEKNPIDLTGWTARMQVRNTVGGKVLADLSTENGGIQIDPLVGRLKVSISRNATRSMPVGRGSYDVFIVSPDDFAIKLIEGDVGIVASVTRG
jgi:hypothetical protein